MKKRTKATQSPNPQGAAETLITQAQSPTDTSSALEKKYSVAEIAVNWRNYSGPNGAA
jgi:hypothetical protein